MRNSQQNTADSGGQALQENELGKPADQAAPNHQPSTGKLSVMDVYGVRLNNRLQNEQVLGKAMSSEAITKLQSAGKQIFREISEDEWNGLLADAILGKSTKLEDMLKTELNSAETALQEAEAGGDAALRQQAQAQISSIREVQAQILEAKGKLVQAENSVNQEDGGLTEAPNNGTIGDKEGATEGKGETIYKAGIPKAKVDEIIKSLPGSRPDPKTYLSKEYISNHLGKFSDGVTKIKYKAPTGYAGPPDGTFVMPLSVADDLIAKANGDISILEQLLGLAPGSLGKNPVRIDIANPTGLRMPSGNEFGANAQWIPGGYTSGKIPEIIIDSPAPWQYIVRPLT